MAWEAYLFFEGDFKFADSADIATVFHYFSIIETVKMELPVVDGYITRCILGAGKTAEVFSLESESQKETYTILKVAKEGFRV